MYEFGWILIYVCIFGYSDYFVKNYCKSINIYLLYYFMTGVIGIFIITLHSKKNILNQKRTSNTNSVMLL